MNSVLVFTGRSAVDGSDFRWQLLRVPEVSKTLKDAQLILDACVGEPKDLVAFMQSDNNDYLSGGLWRELCAQLVQIGLYRRFQRHYSQPRFIIGDAGDISSAQVCLGKITIQDLVLAFVEELAKRKEDEKSLDFLVGHRLESASVFERVELDYVMTSEGKGAISLLDGIMKDHIIHQVITLGSVASLGMAQQDADTGFVESVVMDPLLSWLWPYLRVA